MGRISELPDDLLIKILSYLPTEVAASTSILSKKWEFLWMWLPNLEFGSTQIFVSKFKRLLCFLLRNLPKHRAPVIESFCLRVPTSEIKPEDIKLLVLFAVSRDVRELEISYLVYYLERDILPSSLYTCKFLVTLKLQGSTLVDVPSIVCLPSLKTLLLKNVSYVTEDSFQRLLSNCPVLEDLSVYGSSGKKLRKLIVMVSSLKRLSLEIRYHLDEFVLGTPSLKYLKLDYFFGKNPYVSIENMPQLKEAFVEVSFPSVDRLMGSIPSVEQLSFCLSFCNVSKVVYDDGFIFNQLKHLKLCMCESHSADILVHLLKISPNLQVLELIGMEDHGIHVIPQWNQPSIVPECMLSSLQTFKWLGYFGREDERQLAIYILQNAPILKTATIMSVPIWFETHDMLMELELSSRASTTCQFVFY